MALDFDGLKVLDFTQVLAGPFAAQQLAMLGADVTKIEPPNGGDLMRDRMLPSEHVDKGLASPFMSLNFGKKSLALDLKNPDGLAVAMRLIKSADVVIHNFRAGVVDRLGLDYESVRAVNEKIVYCSISGYGLQGPRAKDAAFDSAIQAGAGMMASNGHEQTGPTRTGYFPVDMMTGISAAFAVTAALLRRERTGEGKAVDVAMFDAAVTMHAAGFAQFLVDGRQSTLIGNGSATGQPTADSFETADGLLLISAVGQPHVELLFDELGIKDAMQDARFATVDARITNAAALRETVTAALAHDSAASWASRLAARGVPSSRVNSIGEACDEPQLAHRDVIVQVDVPAISKQPLKLVGAAFTASEDGPTVTGPPPLLGEHSHQVLSGAGYSADQIAALMADGVVK